MCIRDSQVPMSSIRIWVMPGEAATSGGQTFFSVHKSELVTLLNENFLPYTDKVTEETLQITELANSGTADKMCIRDRPISAA